VRTYNFNLYTYNFNLFTYNFNLYTYNFNLYTYNFNLFTYNLRQHGGGPGESRGSYRCDQAAGGGAAGANTEKTPPSEHGPEGKSQQQCGAGRSKQRWHGPQQ
jgi:hypothetical protein